MFKGLPFKHLPPSLHLAKLTSKIAVGIIFISFLLGYQPTLAFPPIKESLALAEQPSQTQTINPKELPFTFQLPHPGYISTHFSFYHQGVDLAAPLGTLIHPVASGTVIEAGYDLWGLGLMVTIDHGYGYQSLYGHMGKIFVKKGDKVTDKDYLGEIGLTGHTTGPHTHLQISKDGVNFDPLEVLPTLRDYPLPEDFTK